MLHCSYSFKARSISLRASAYLNIGPSILLIVISALRFLAVFLKVSIIGPTSAFLVCNITTFTSCFA